MQEMREMYQGRGGNGGGQFRIGTILNINLKLGLISR
jgi:hypothetical protein